ncbi:MULTISPECIES: DivIVA domain-containing protein [unclassified Blastococcus]
MAMRGAVLDPTPAGGTGAGAPRTAAPGALEGLLGTGPCFTGALRGYDRLQVDNYVAWAEAEIAAARRESDHLLSRYAASSSELQEARRRLAQLARERDAAPQADPARQLLVDAAEHAAVLTAAAEAEAERIRREAREEAEARLRNVADLRAAAVAVREQAAAELEAARRELDAARTAAAAQQAELVAEVAELRRQRDEARGSLRRLREQVDVALQVVALPDEAGERALVAS